MFCKHWPQDKLHLESPQSRARQGRPRAALLAPVEGAAPANTSWACFRKGGMRSSFLGHKVPGSANAGDMSPWLRANTSSPLLPHVSSGPSRGKDWSQPGSEIALRRGLQGHRTGLAEAGGSNKVVGADGGGKNPPPRAPGWGRLAAIQGRRVVPGGDARRWKGGGCHEEAAEDAGSGETGAAPAFPKHRLLGRTGKPNNQQEPCRQKTPSTKIHRAVAAALASKPGAAVAGERKQSGKRART